MPISIQDDQPKPWKELKKKKDSEPKDEEMTPVENNSPGIDQNEALIAKLMQEDADREVASSLNQ